MFEHILTAKASPLKACTVCRLRHLYIVVKIIPDMPPFPPYFQHPCYTRHNGIMISFSTKVKALPSYRISINLSGIINRIKMKYEQINDGPD